jgi:hypothetical protein
LSAIEEESPFLYKDIEIYEYLAYLRHHGFPSPLLDWTYSPYVAAFFAMRDVSEKTDYVSVYVYLEYSGVGKLSSSTVPSIYSLGPNLRVHQRHYLQQSCYTFCVMGASTDRYYMSHDEVQPHPEDAQDLLWKLNIPALERVEFLGRLNQMNINSYSLIRNVESLVESIAVSEILLNGM